ncbi:hypothetical protein ACWDSD_01720 [Streptomyces spiralis]
MGDDRHGHTPSRRAVPSVPLAVLAAIANALASVLQRKAVRERPESESLSWRLVWSLLHRRFLVAAVVVWARLAGVGARKAALLGVAAGCG